MPGTKVPKILKATEQNHPATAMLPMKYQVINRREKSVSELNCNCCTSNIKRIMTSLTAVVFFLSMISGKPKREKGSTADTNSSNLGYMNII